MCECFSSLKSKLLNHVHYLTVILTPECTALLARVTAPSVLIVCCSIYLFIFFQISNSPPVLILLAFVSSCSLWGFYSYLVSKLLVSFNDSTDVLSLWLPMVSSWLLIGWLWRDHRLIAHRSDRLTLNFSVFKRMPNSHPLKSANKSIT